MFSLMSPIKRLKRNQYFTNASKRKEHFLTYSSKPVLPSYQNQTMPHKEEKNFNYNTILIFQNYQSQHFQTCKLFQSFSPTCLLSGSHWRMGSIKMREKSKKKEDIKYNKEGNQQRKEAKRINSKVVKKSQRMRVMLQN